MSGTRSVRIAGTVLRIADDEGGFWDRAERGDWEPATLALVSDRIRPGTLFIDLGAWVGPLSLLAAARGAQVIAVEADPAALADLRRNVAANPGLAPQIEIVAGAVAPRPGEVRLGARRKPGDSMSSTLLAHTAGAWTVPAVTPDMLAARAVGSAELFVKLDIEGGEYALLPALAPLLAHRPIACLVAFHPALLREAGAPDAAAATETALAALHGLSASLVGGTPFARLGAADLEQGDLWLFESTALEAVERSAARSSRQM